MSSLLTLILLVTAASAQSPPIVGCGPNGTVVGFHQARCDANGNLLPWTDTIEAAVELEIAYYQNMPRLMFGFPTFVYSTFLRGDYSIVIPKGFQIIPGMQDGMGILSYLKYYERTSLPGALEYARLLGDYVVTWCNSPPRGPWANFTRSSGVNLDWPLEVASMADIEYGVDTIEPDKGAIAAYALVKLYNVTGNVTYLNQALHNARVLVTHQSPGTNTSAPWPFRVNSLTGLVKDIFAQRNGNMAYALRLFRSVAALGFDEFDQPARSLWSWIRDFQLTVNNSDPTQSLFVNFFEDQTIPNNRNSWSALELARYLIEERNSGLDPDWYKHVQYLIAFAIDNFSTGQIGNVTNMGEQDEDHDGWGGANSKLGGVAALFACAGGPSYYRQMALNNMAWMTYYIDVDGCPGDHAWKPYPFRGGWQEDCHTDVLHNFVDALNAFDGRC